MAAERAVGGGDERVPCAVGRCEGAMQMQRSTEACVKGSFLPQVRVLGSLDERWTRRVGGCGGGARVEATFWPWLCICLLDK